MSNKIEVSQALSDELAGLFTKGFLDDRMVSDIVSVVRKHDAPATINHQGDVLEPVEGDQLPPIGSKVLIHLASSDAWIEHTVAGYYAWGDLGGNANLHRVFVRVVDADGFTNARLLKDVRNDQ